MKSLLLPFYLFGPLLVQKPVPGHRKVRKTAPFVVLTFYILTREMFFSGSRWDSGRIDVYRLSSSLFPTFFLFRYFFPRSLFSLDRTASSSGASFFAWQRRARNASDWWWTAWDHGKGLLPAFLCAHIERETSGYEAGPGYVLVVGITDTPVYILCHD